MFKIETVVALLSALTLSFSPAVMAQANESTAPSSTCASYAERHAAALDESPLNQEKIDRFQAAIDNCIRTNGTDYATGGCNTAKTEYAKATGALATACNTLGGGYSGESGWPLCTKAVNQCDACSNPSANREGLDCGEVSVQEEESSSSRSGVFGLRNVATGTVLLKYCPGKLGSEQKDLEKEMKESQKLVRELEEKVPKMQLEYTDIISATENQISETEDMKVDAQSKFDEQLQTVSSSKDAELRALQEQIVAIEEQVARVDDSIRQVQLEKVNDEIKYQEALTQINMNCHSKASTVVAKIQDDRLQLEKARQYNRQSFQNMMRQVGVSDRESWQRLAEKYYGWCLKESATKAAKESAKQQYSVALRAREEAIVKLGRDKDRLRQKIKAIDGENGCSGGAPADPSSEPAKCAASRKAQEAAQLYERQLNKEMFKLDRKIAQIKKDGANKAQAKMAEVNNVQKQLREEKLRLDNFKEYLELVYRAAGGGTAADAKNYTAAQEKYGEFVEAASTYVNCTAQGTCEGTTACKTASDFLFKIDVHPGFSDESLGESAVEDAPAAGAAGATE